MTGLEPATSRPPDACANQLRYIPKPLFKKLLFPKANAKVRTNFYLCKLLCIFFSPHFFYHETVHTIEGTVYHNKKAHRPSIV